jgi:3-oxoacyl-[acyl-carrier-protein] synthase II
MPSNRVVITGLGVVSSIGIGKDEFWNAILHAKSGISKVHSFDTKEFRCHNAGEIKSFAPENYLDNRRIGFLGKTSQLALTATHLALKDAKIHSQAIKGVKTGVFIGTTMGERPLQESIDSWVKDGVSKMSKYKIIQSTANVIPGNIATYFKFNGPNYLISNACAAAGFALGYGFDLIKSGSLDYAIVGGADSFSKTAFSGFHRLYAMAPEKCQPFDKNRKGMMVGEGAGILILESLDAARERKADIYAEVLGYGLSCDAFHITSPKPEGIAKAMHKALQEADVKPGDIDYINAHGTGTPANDKSECAGIKKVFKDHYKTIPVSSIKSMIGHTMGAASSIETIASCMAIKNEILPPTINFETPDPDCDIDCIPNTPRPKKIYFMLKDSFAFGGNNCCIVLKKYE